MTTRQVVQTYQAGEGITMSCGSRFSPPVPICSTSWATGFLPLYPSPF